VRITPRGVLIAPVRALPSVACRSNEKRWVIGYPFAGKAYAA